MARALRRHVTGASDIGPFATATYAAIFVSFGVSSVSIVTVSKKPGVISEDETSLAIPGIISKGLSTGGTMGATKIHPFDTSSITVILVSLLLVPGIGVMNWKEAQNKINWGTICLFGVGISLGSAIISTKAGPWLAQNIVPAFGLTASSPFMILAIMALFLIIIHMGFASATALASALIPIIISVLSEVAKTQPGLNILGMTMILQYVVSFGFILPANAPQNMIAYGTETFTVKQFIRTGIPLTFLAYGCILLLSATYWKWLGYV